MFWTPKLPLGIPPLRSLCLLAISAVLLGACSKDAPAGPRPNIVLISLDNLGANHMGCYGYFRNTTPFMDSLAAAGMIFDEMVAQDTWTLPSHVSMLTSRYVSAHGVWNRDLKLNNVIMKDDETPVTNTRPIKREIQLNRLKVV